MHQLSYLRFFPSQNLGQIPSLKKYQYFNFPHDFWTETYWKAFNKYTFHNTLPFVFKIKNWNIILDAIASLEINEFSKKWHDKKKAYFWTKMVSICLLSSYAGQPEHQFTYKCLNVEIIQIILRVHLITMQYTGTKIYLSFVYGIYFWNKAPVALPIMTMEEVNRCLSRNILLPCRGIFLKIYKSPMKDLPLQFHFNIYSTGKKVKNYTICIYRKLIYKVSVHNSL